MKRTKKIGLILSLLLLAAWFVPAGLWRLSRQRQTLASALATTAGERENTLTKDYFAKKVPAEIATLAAAIDRREEDIAALSKALACASANERESLSSALITLEDEELALLSRAAPVLEKQAEKAYRNHNVALFKMVQALQSRSFLFERN